MARRAVKEIKKEAVHAEKEEKIPYAANVGRVMNVSKIIGDGALVKKAK